MCYFYRKDSSSLILMVSWVASVWQVGETTQWHRLVTNTINYQVPLTSPGKTTKAACSREAETLTASCRMGIWEERESTLIHLHCNPTNTKTLTLKSDFSHSNKISGEKTILKHGEVCKSYLLHINSTNSCAWVLPQGSGDPEEFREGQGGQQREKTGLNIQGKKESSQPPNAKDLGKGEMQVENRRKQRRMEQI